MANTSDPVDYCKGNEAKQVHEERHYEDAIQRSQGQSAPEGKLNHPILRIENDREQSKVCIDHQKITNHNRFGYDRAKHKTKVLLYQQIDFSFENGFVFRRDKRSARRN